MSCCPEGAAVSVAALAAEIAKERTPKELLLLGAVYIQLGYTMRCLSAYAAFSDSCFKGKNVKEMLLLSAVFVQLGNTLLTIAAVHEVCAAKETN